MFYINVKKYFIRKIHIMNILRTIRNNWKKSTFAAVATGYGIYSAKTHIEITMYMRQLCNDVSNLEHRKNRQNEVAKKVLVVMNPMANKKKAEKFFNKYCEPILHLAGYSVEVLRTKHIGHAKTYIEDLSALPDAIVIAGGDGTTSEVVTGLMRRRTNPCPIVLLPLGRNSQSAFKYIETSGKNDLDYVKALSGALMSLLKDECKYESVIQYDVLKDNDDEITENVSLKPIFGLSRFSWGLMKEIDSSKDKFWYFGSLRHYAAAFLKSFSSNLCWNFKTDYIYTPPCAGCSNCFVERQAAPASSGFFLRKLLASKNNNDNLSKQRMIKNDKCSNQVHGNIETNQLNIACTHNDDNYSELESKFISSLQPGWDFIKNIPNVTNNALAPSLVLRSRTIQLYPAATASNASSFYSIDGEEYDARPIKVSIVPDAIKVFC